MAKKPSSLNASSGSPWTVLIVVLLAGLSGPINYYKAPPLMLSLMSDLRLSGGTAGLLMSVFAVVGVLFSFPAGILLQRLGPKTTGLLGVASIAAGAASGALTSNPVVFLFTRLVEGIGLNLMALSAPTAVALYFEGRRRAIAVGIWNAWYPVGSTITFLVAPVLASHWGWRSVWWFGCLYALAAGVLYLVAMKSDNGSRSTHSSTRPLKNSGDDPRSALNNREVWIMSALFFSFAFIYIGYLTWTATFLHTAKGLSLAHAALLMSILSVGGIVSSLLSGWILGKLDSPKILAIMVLAVFSSLASLTSVIAIGYVCAAVIIMGAIGGFLPATSLVVVARLVHEKRVGPVAFSIVMVGQNVGILLGPTLFGIAMTSSYGWPLAYALFIPAGAVGVIAAAFLPRARADSGSSE